MLGLTSRTLTHEGVEFVGPPWPQTMMSSIFVDTPYSVQAVVAEVAPQGMQTPVELLFRVAMQRCIFLTAVFRLSMCLRIVTAVISRALGMSQVFSP